MTTRIASHAGSWYNADEGELREDLDGWTTNVPSDIEGIGGIPRGGARVIIAPHAGYAYSGPAAAWAYRSLDVSQANRVFLLGPSHTKYLNGCELSRHTTYATPLGNIPLDHATIRELRETGQFGDMDARTDETEHSLEMHLPYIYHTFKRTTNSDPPPLVPILVGSTNAVTEKDFGALLAPYLLDPENIFIISSDFCHWGTRFSYTYYVPSSSTHVEDGRQLGGREKPSDPPIHESIARVDKAAMAAIETGRHDTFLRNLRQTGNTVCGRHPIGVIMAAMETLKKEGKLAEDKGRFKFVRYERSHDVKDARDSSVSYASAFAVL